jgi:hypothetical protein
MIAGAVIAVLLYAVLTSGGVFLMLRQKRTFLRALGWGAMFAVPSRILAGTIGMAIANVHGASMPYPEELAASALLGAILGALLYGAQLAFGAATKSIR